MTSWQGEAGGGGSGGHVRDGGGGGGGGRGGEVHQRRYRGEGRLFSVPEQLGLIANKMKFVWEPEVI